MKTLPIILSHDDIKELYPNAAGFDAFAARPRKKGVVRQVKRIVRIS